MPKGANWLAPAIAAIVEGCIERLCLTRQKLTGAALLGRGRAALRPTALIIGR
jgi:hypothetical protein